MKKEYLDLTRMIERLHRRFLDVLRAELNRLEIKDLNAVQALLLANIGDEEIAIRDLIERGYYQGSNVSYNIKKLTETGFLEQKRSPHDRRSVNVKLTKKALEFTENLKKMEDHHAQTMKAFGLTPIEVEVTLKALKRLERTWTDYIHYGPND
ncbi:Transcriptional regulator [Candidatus Terasakiella magnetica]|uniref:Transcriptional regulator n=1 Tax=Candidatus Terasakiella magnetica TaxID=1867952 RepID=A0A1C3RI33_9PROT|nr:winged helix DNA-binding protein [Candidatus Terasakiella magnetica]SCA56939.1 Transcriptional regulator [Candidatus Terasakiella magnetica]